MNSQSFLLYTLKLVMLSAIFIGYYWLALRNKRFHYFNRFYLIVSMLLSFMVPMIRFNWVSEEKPVIMGSGETIDLIVVSARNSSRGINIYTSICLLMMVITCLLLVNICYRIIKIYQLKRSCETYVMNGFDLVQTDDESAPFSFLDNLFWKKSISIDDEGGKQIFKHELTHIRQKHTWDKLFAQLCCSIFWINPFFWLMQKELEAIHEFIADEAAVADQNTESFAKMLLQAHFGNHFLETKHSFYYSSIKRRLTMLTTTTNIKFSFLRRVMLLPLLFAAISVFSVRVQAKEKIEQKINAVSETIFPNKTDTVNPRTLTVKPNYFKGKKVASSSTEGDNTLLKFEDRTTETVNIVQGHKLDATKQSATTEIQEKTIAAIQDIASFPGGQAGWLNYLSQNLNMNKPVEKGAGPGQYKVNLNFVVDEEGDVKDVIAENNPGYYTKEEAIRVLLSSPKWIPAKQDGKAVSSRVKKTITFQISEE